MLFGRRFSSKYHSFTRDLIKKYIHITFAGKACSIAKENLWRCPLHWYAALGRKTTAVHLHVRKRKLRSSHSKLFEVQPIECVAHLFGIAMSIFKIMVIQAEIRHFAHTVFIEEDVACGQITMDNLRKSRKLLTLWSRPRSVLVATERRDLAFKYRKCLVYLKERSMIIDLLHRFTLHFRNEGRRHQSNFH